MSGKGKEVECAQEDGESLRKPRRTRGVTEKGKGDQILGLNRMMTDDELHRYLEKLEESEGYDAEWPPDCVACGGIRELVPDGDYPMDRLLRMANHALDEYNKAQGTQLGVEKVEKANRGLCEDGLKYYITFHVVDPYDHADPIKVFQAQVVKTFQGAGDLVHQVRPKPTVKTSKKGRRRKPTAAA